MMDVITLPQGLEEVRVWKRQSHFQRQPKGLGIYDSQHLSGCFPVATQEKAAD